MGFDVLEWIDRYLPKPGSGAGYKPSEYIFPLLLMLNGGGRGLEDIRQMRADEGLREILPLERIPCGQLNANAMFFKIGTLAYNLFRLVTLKVLSPSWHRHQVQTVRWRLYQIAGKIVFHGGKVFVKVRRGLCQLFKDIRVRIWEVATT